jgi:uncharacterized protein with GYD domain
MPIDQLSRRPLSLVRYLPGLYPTTIKETEMPKYLAQANYTSEGVKGLLKEGGSSRRAAIEKLFESAGARIEAFYYAFGETDLFIIIDGPDNVTAASLSLTVNAVGAVATKVTVLLTPEEIDAATKLSPLYRPPGQ